MYERIVDTHVSPQGATQSRYGQTPGTREYHFLTHRRTLTTADATQRLSGRIGRRTTGTVTDSALLHRHVDARFPVDINLRNTVRIHDDHCLYADRQVVHRAILITEDGVFKLVCSIITGASQRLR